MEGVRIACLYSYGCPELEKIQKQNVVLDFIKNPQDNKCSLVKETLKGLNPFLFYQLIGLQNDIEDPFEEKVVRTYWLGGGFLKTITKKDVQNLLAQKNLQIHSLHLTRISDLINGKAHHNFETILLLKGIRDFQKLTREFIEKLNDCLVRAGKVISVGHWAFKVRTKSISFKKGEIVFEDSLELIPFDLLREIKTGDFISIHLCRAREKIGKETAENLIEITKEAISFFQG